MLIKNKIFINKMDYYNEYLKRRECYQCMQEPLQFKMDYFNKCLDKKRCDNCIKLYSEYYFNQMPKECGQTPEFSCMHTGQYCHQHNGSDYEWIFNLPDKYNALLELRKIIYPDNCFDEDL